MWVEHAIFTSLERHGRAGYHVVARSPGITDADARALATWCPSHDALIVDDHNHQSLNFHPLAPSRYALSRTCAGPPEYSGRGGRQLYTDALVLDAKALQRAGFPLFSLFRAAQAEGHLRYQHDPPAVLTPIEISGVYAPNVGKGLPRDAGNSQDHDFEQSSRELAAGGSVRLTCASDRILLAERLISLLSEAAVAKVSFTTSLRPSQARPVRLLLEAPEQTDQRTNGPRMIRRISDIPNEKAARSPINGPT